MVTAGFSGTRVVGDQDARLNFEHGTGVAAAQIRVHCSAVAEVVRRLLEPDHRGAATCQAAAPGH